jgi:hypothetical protein
VSPAWGGSDGGNGEGGGTIQGKGSVRLVIWYR